MKFACSSGLRNGIISGIALVVFSAAPALADSAPPPDFDSVLAAPDDLNQNLAFARGEAAAGHLLSAAAALERILLVDPDANGVRLFYAAVLWRLDDLQGAQQQLDALKGVPLTPLQQAEADKYRKLIARGRSGVKVGGTIGAGVAFDSDALGALNTELEFFGKHPQKNGGAAVVSGSLDISKDLTANGDRALFASASIYSRSSFAGPDADYQNGEIHVGVMGSNLKSAWQVGALFRHYQLFDAPYLSEYGGRAEYSWRPDTSLTWMAAFEAVGQTYHEPFIAFLVPFVIPGTHDGARFDLNGGASYRLSAQSTLTGVVGVEVKTAGYDPFAYTAPYLYANYHTLLGSGAYLDAQGTMRFVEYDKADKVFLFGIKREDVRSTARVALGAPLSAFTPAGATGDYREDIIVEGAVNYTGRTSRLPVAPYNDVGLDLRLVWKFGNRG